MSLNNTPPAPTTGQVANPQMQQTNKNGVSVTRAPDANTQAGWSGVSPAVNNGPTTSL